MKNGTLKNNIPPVWEVSWHPCSYHFDKDYELSILWQRLPQYATIEEEEQINWEVRQ